MERHSVIISDVHLCEEFPGNDTWMRFRQRRYFPDDDFASFFAYMQEKTQGDRVEFIFNGDLFDFDAPSLQELTDKTIEEPRTEAAAVQAIDRILNDHTDFIRTLAKMLDSGHSLVFISGNHDVQLTFAGVRDVIRQRILDATSHLPENPNERIRFRNWFYRTKDNIHVEHGNQYDLYCSFRYPTAPYATGKTFIQPTFGSLTFRHLAGKLGYFNPYVEDSYYLPFWMYLLHWVKYYLFSARSMVFTVLQGTFKTAATIWNHPSKREPEREHVMIQEYTSLVQATPEQIKAHAALFSTPSDSNLHSIVREFWLDRVAFILGSMLFSLLGFFLLGKSAAIGIAATGIMAWLIYEIIVPKLHYPSVYTQINALQPTLAEIYGVRGVIFGHTHAPYARWAGARFFANTGTWSPPQETEFDGRKIPKNRHIIWLRSTGNGDVTGGLYSWEDDALIEGGARPS